MDSAREVAIQLRPELKASKVDGYDIPAHSGTKSHSSAAVCENLPRGGLGEGRGEGAEAGHSNKLSSKGELGNKMERQATQHYYGKRPPERAKSGPDIWSATAAHQQGEGNKKDGAKTLALLPDGQPPGRRFELSDCKSGKCLGREIDQRLLASHRSHAARWHRMTSSRRLRTGATRCGLGGHRIVISCSSRGR